jgi:D-alanine-D-alanine ligase
MKNSEKRVAVIFGGQSGEHDVSLASARSVMAVLRKKGHQVFPIGITRKGHWLLHGDPYAMLSDVAATPDLIISEPGSANLGGDRELVPGATGAALPPVEVVFPVLHGPFGEDGTIQGLLELSGVPYVGCGVLASSLAMDKIACKHVLVAHGLPVVPWQAVLRRVWDAEPHRIISDVEATLGYPVFVKPANLGSSIGINKAADRAELVLALNEAAQYDRRILVEQAVTGAREIECSVLGNDDPVASVPGEVVPSNDFYDYAAKYIDGKSKLLIPAPLPSSLTARVRELSTAAFRAIDGAGLARVDFLLSGTTGDLYISELNTLPGFTAISMYPKLWEASGIPYDELVERLIDLALERHSDRLRSQTGYHGGKLTV